PFMTEKRFRAGDHLFRINDEARDIYYLESGKVLVEELGIELGAGEMVGEIAMFSPDRRRTQSVRCLEDCTFLQISEAKILELYAENPEFGLYLIKMIVARLLANMEKKQAEVSTG
ncbi:MAG: cyclic nucleotide-binding domain-containing protein, partial [Rhodospirillales bacterium]